MTPAERAEVEVKWKCPEVLRAVPWPLCITKHTILSIIYLHQDESNPLMPLSSGDCSMPIEPPPRRERGPKGGNASTRILADMATRKLQVANTKGGNKVENLHDDIDSLFQLHYLPPPVSTTDCGPASFLLFSTSYCYEIVINSVVPG